MTTSGPAGPPTPYPAFPGAGSPAQVPGPPPGPGAVPPFAAPPTEGRTFRVWLGLGVAALAVLLCCGGGTVAVIGLGISGSQAVNEQARAVVGDYFDAVVQRDFGTAYGLLCPDLRRQESPGEFERRQRAEPQITSFRVGEPAVTITDLTVPVDVTFRAGQSGRLTATLQQDTQTGAFRVCGIG